MVSIDEVRARVQAAAERQIQERTDTAAQVVQQLQDVTAKRAAVAAAEQGLGEAMRAALAVMSLDELAEFTGLRKSDLPGTPARRTSVRATGLQRRQGRTGGNPGSAPDPHAAASDTTA